MFLNMIRIFTIKNEVIFNPETIALFGLLDNLNCVSIEEHNYNLKGESRFHNLIEACKTMFEYVDDITDCDICVMPYKHRGVNDPLFRYLFELCLHHDKILYIFYNDDNDRPIAPDCKNIKIYRTSFYKSTKQDNEYALPAVDADHFDGYIKDPKLSIGFCGAYHCNRMKYLQILHDSDIETNFILRSGFWAPEVSVKKNAKAEYMDNIRDNIFTFCYRGVGNFSYRFYDVMMMGRIPVFINTDCVLPFEDKYTDIGIIINEGDDMVQSIKDYYTKNKHRLYEIQQNNRNIWEKFYSPVGFLANFI